MQLDFSNIKDDQLLQLIQQALAEAAKRGVAMRTAIQDVILDEQEKARIRLEATERAQAESVERQRQAEIKKIQEQAEAAARQKELDAEQQKIKTLWGKQKAIGTALEEWGLTEDWQINLWSRGSDRRVYLDGGGTDRSWAWKICYYVTGNLYHPPGELTIEGKKALQQSDGNPLDTSESFEQLQAFFQEFVKRWSSLKLSHSECVRCKEPSFPAHLEAYRTALGLDPKTGEKPNVVAAVETGVE